MSQQDNSNSPAVTLTVNGMRAGPPSRREAMQWVLGAVAAASLPANVLGAAPGKQAVEEGRNIVSQEQAAKIPNPKPGVGYGTDPELTKIYKPGEVWPLTFNETQKKTARALADVILPRDQYGPAASEVGVVEMVDEWVSAPYPEQQKDRPVVLQGLDWLDAESRKRFGNKGFFELSDQQQRAICDDIHFTQAARPEFRQGAEFFNRFRSICAGAYYATPAGWKAIGYVGNEALPSFEGPPPEVLQRLGVTQTVK